MLFTVRHVTAYTYGQPVRLGPHWLRLRPRPTDAGELLHFALEIDPAPAGRSEVTDPDGNRVTRVWFDGPTRRLTVTSRFGWRTPDPAAGDEPAIAVPLDAPYTDPLRARLAPWIDAPPVAAPVRALAGVLRAGSDDALDFVQALNLWLCANVLRGVRETGAPQSPEQTLRLGTGACRDLAVLFVAVCRSQGLAARFVSGYQRGRDAAAGAAATVPPAASPAASPATMPAGSPPAGTAAQGDEPRYMHAWPEVYLPASGWRGFDPTHGTPVADAHVALAAAAAPEDAAPIEGHYLGHARSRLRAAVQIDVAD